MPTLDARLHRRFRQFTVAAVCLLGVLGCEDDQAPVPQPAGVDIVSGDAQYTLKGTQLEEPVVVRVGLEDGSAAAGVAVQFQVIEGSGTLSRTLATTDADGRTSVRWTVGPDTGANRLRISVTENSSVSATATATAADYYCVEEDPTFVQRFFGASDLMMLTRESIHTAGAAGLIHFDLDTPGLEFSGQALVSYPDDAFQYAVRDCAFSANGDLFLSWKHRGEEVVKVASNGSVSHFATLDDPFGSEITMTPAGVLVGCDGKGPFYVTCRDSIYRFEDAIFSGVDRDAANNDALACDPVNGDVYFIYKADRRLYRIPFDGTTAGTKERVLTPDVALDFDVSDLARGMAVDGTDGSLYILVESANTKSIMRVASGTLSTVYDFFDRGAGDLAGIQNDLAIDRDLGYLFTLDTKNNQILLYRISTDELFALNSDGNPESASSDNGDGERVGLDVIAGP